MDEKKSFKNKLLMVVLVAIILALSSFILYDKVLSNNDKESSGNTSQEENTQDNVVSCNNCVDFIDLTRDDNGDSIDKTYKVLLNNKILDLKIVSGSVYVDNKLIASDDISDLSLNSVMEVYVIDNDVLLVTYTGGDINTISYKFFNNNLEEIYVNMMFDSKYPSLAQASTINNSLVVVGKKLTVIATRKSHGPSLVLSKDESIEFCDEKHSENLKKYNGELVTAKYEATYLGNGKFSDWKQVEVLERIDDNFCESTNN